MKKWLAMLAAGTVLTTSSMALAAESVKFSGDVTVKYEKDTAEGADDVSGTMSSVRLKGEADLGKGWSLYARFGAQHATQPGLADYNTDPAVYGDKKSVMTIDQFGFTRQAGDMLLKIGRQDLTVGTTALLYSRSESNIGKRAFVDGITANGTMGGLDVTAAFVQEDNAGEQDNRLYAIHTVFQKEKPFQWGMTLGRYQDSAAGDTNHWAVDSSYRVGKHNWTAEYTQSDRSNENHAYAVTWEYGFDDKTAVYLTGFRVEANGDMGKQSDFDNNNKGMYYGLKHQFSKENSFELVYKDQKSLAGGEKNTKLEATFTHSI
nr:porin [uncultured Anaeromusa sp.]